VTDNSYLVLNNSVVQFGQDVHVKGVLSIENSNVTINGSLILYPSSVLIINQNTQISVGSCVTLGGHLQLDQVIPNG